MNAFLSQKFRFYSFVSMLLLVFVHGYNLHNRYLQPWTPVNEPLTITTFTEYLFANGLFRWRIPMLFAISGYLFAMHDDKPYGTRIKKRLRTLLLPYFLWSIIGLLTAVLLTYWSATREVVYNTHLQPSDKPFNAYTFSDWIGAILWPTSYQLWFIRCLFIYNLAYPLLLKGITKYSAVVFSIFTFLWLTTFGLILFEGEGLLFFSVGTWLCKKNKDLQTLPSWMNLPLLIIIFFTVSILKTWLAFYLDGQGLYLFLFVALLHKISVLTGLVVVWFGCDAVVRLCMNKSWFVHLSAFSFIIYALHVPLTTYMIDPFFAAIQYVTGYRLLTFIFLPSLIITFCICIGWILRTVAPKVYSVLTGGRGF